MSEITDIRAVAGGYVVDVYGYPLTYTFATLDAAEVMRKKLQGKHAAAIRRAKADGVRDAKRMYDDWVNGVWCDAMDFRDALDAHAAQIEEADRGGRRKWTREKPTEPGWYWWQRSANDEPVVVHITDLHADKILRIEYPQGDYGRLSNCTGSFQGPITPREDAP